MIFWFAALARKILEALFLTAFLIDEFQVAHSLDHAVVVFYHISQSHIGAFKDEADAVVLFHIFLIEIENGPACGNYGLIGAIDTQCNLFGGEEARC